MKSLNVWQTLWGKGVGKFKTPIKRNGDHGKGGNLLNEFAWTDDRPERNVVLSYNGQEAVESPSWQRPEAIQHILKKKPS